MIDGKPYKTFKRHASSHGLTLAEYRERYHLPASYPSVAQAYSELRRATAARNGLGRKTDLATTSEAVEAPATNQTVTPVAKVTAKTKTIDAPKQKSPKRKLASSTPKFEATAASTKADSNSVPETPVLKAKRSRAEKAAPASAPSRTRKGPRVPGEVTTSPQAITEPAVGNAIVATAPKRARMTAAPKTATAAAQPVAAQKQPRRKLKVAEPA